MKFDWKNWSIGGKIIFIMACVSSVSMLIKWVEVGTESETGLSQGAFLYLALYIYPVMMLLKNKPIQKIRGIACSAISAILAVNYISSRSIELFGETVNVAAGGVWLFLLASIGLFVGVMKYTPIENNESIPNSYTASAGQEQNDFDLMTHKESEVQTEADPSSSSE